MHRLALACIRRSRETWCVATRGVWSTALFVLVVRCHVFAIATYNVLNIDVVLWFDTEELYGIFLLRDDIDSTEFDLPSTLGS